MFRLSRCQKPYPSRRSSTGQGSTGFGGKENSCQPQHRCVVLWAFTDSTLKLVGLQGWEIPAHPCFFKIFIFTKNLKVLSRSNESGIVVLWRFEFSHISHRGMFGISLFQATVVPRSRVQEAQNCRDHPREHPKPCSATAPTRREHRGAATIRQQTRQQTQQIPQESGAATASWQGRSWMSSGSSCCTTRACPRR